MRLTVADSMVQNCWSTFSKFILNKKRAWDPISLIAIIKVTDLELVQN